MAGVWFRLNLNLRKTTDWLSFGHVSDSIKWALIDAFYMADNSLEKNFITLAITGKHTSTGKLKIFYVNTQTQTLRKFYCFNPIDMCSMLFDVFHKK